MLKLVGLWLLALLTIVATLFASSAEDLFLPVYGLVNGPIGEIPSTLRLTILNIVMCLTIALIFGFWAGQVAIGNGRRLVFNWLPFAGILLLGICDYLYSQHELVPAGLIRLIILLATIFLVVIAAWEATWRRGNSLQENKAPPV